MDKAIFFNTMTEPKGGVYSGPIIILVIVMVAVMVLLVGLIVGIISSAKNTTIALTDKELIIKTMFYGRTITRDKIIASETKAINLNENPDYDVSLRLNGTGLSNMKIGWFRLKNGMKSLTYITDKDNVVLIPTTDDYVILFSMNNINEFVTRIKNPGR